MIKRGDMNNQNVSRIVSQMKFRTHASGASADSTPAEGLSLAQVHKPGSQQEHNRGEAIWDGNLGPAR